MPDHVQFDRPRIPRASAPRGLAGWCHHLALRTLSYVTNEMVNRFPGFWLRMAWYRHVVGVKIDHGAVIYRDCYLAYYGPGRVRATNCSIGRGTIINRKCLLDFRGFIQIGENVSISPEVAIVTAQHKYNSPTFDLEHRGVVIGDNVWIGMRAMILPGVEVGDGAVVAAGAVVTANVAPLAIVGGVPARTIGTRNADAARYIFDAPPVLFE